MECLLEGAGLYWEIEDIMYRPKVAVLKYVEIQWALLSSFGSGQFHEMLKGVPQGAPTSCALATLALRPLEDQMDKATIFNLPENIHPDSEEFGNIL